MQDLGVSDSHEQTLHFQRWNSDIFLLCCDLTYVRIVLASELKIIPFPLWRFDTQLQQLPVVQAGLVKMLFYYDGKKNNKRNQTFLSRYRFVCLQGAVRLTWICAQLYRKKKKRVKKQVCQDEKSATRPANHRRSIHRTCVMTAKWKVPVQSINPSVPSLLWGASEKTCSFSPCSSFLEPGRTSNCPRVRPVTPLHGIRNKHAKGHAKTTSVYPFLFCINR